MVRKIYIAIFVLVNIIFMCGCDIDKSKYDVEVVKEGYTIVDGYLERETQDDYTIVIRDEKELDVVFNKFPQVDFNEKMVIVYIYTSIYSSDVKITDVDYDEDGELSIEFKHKTGIGRGNAAVPKQDVLVIVMDNLYTTDIDIEQD